MPDNGYGDAWLGSGRTSPTGRPRRDRSRNKAQRRARRKARR